MPTFDYIIIGAGASGLLLADALGEDEFFNHKKILLLDKLDKIQNDRTWCFWEEGEGPFDDIVCQSWSKIHFAGSEIDIKPRIDPYQYKMIKGLDFYQCYLEKIKNYPNIKCIVDHIETIEDKGSEVVVRGARGKYVGKQVFDSRFNYESLKQQSNYPVLQQHFLGWFIKTKEPVFDVETASFMDFSIPQNSNTRFMYVLPFSKTHALIEYTLFSAEVLEKSEYESALRDYLKYRAITDYEIIEKEQGNIPMSCFDFTAENMDHYLKIGIAGGWAKPSTGFTFYRSTKKIKELVEYMKTDGPFSKFGKKNRFWFYDLLFLDVLYQYNHLGGSVFESLFRKRSPQLVLKFLDEETTIWEELKMIWACPKKLFVKALLKRIFY